jgi:hypothetical protein
VPVVPFFAIALAPIIEQVAGSKVTGSKVAANTHHASRITFYALLLLSILIQLLGVAINPWVFLGQLQAEFGGEFFLENTAALYDFRYSQIAGQIRAWSLQNSDVAWWQPWGFDGLAFSLSLALVLLSGWLLWRELTTDYRPPTADLMPTLHASRFTFYTLRFTPHISRLLASSLLPVLLLALVLTYFLLARYFITDRQFGPPADPYTRALDTAAAQASPADQIITIAPYHYHVPMNRFKTRLPLTSLSQQAWPPPETAMPLLQNALIGPNAWLVTVGVLPAAPGNTAERWLALNAFTASNDWFEDVRLVRFGTRTPTVTRPVNVTLGEELHLLEAKLNESLEPGQTLPVEFVWQPLQSLQTDYNLFLQLLAADGSLAAQHDSPPNAGYTPTSTWPPGQSMLDRHALAVPFDLPAGDYRLIAGLYNPATGQRLSVDQGEDFVELGRVTLNVRTLNVERSNQ